MSRNLVDRITEAAAILCLVAGLAVPAMSKKGHGNEPDLASLMTRELSGGDAARFRSALDGARRLVDANGKADNVLDELHAAFPGRHEVWVLSARFKENTGRPAPAMVDYARAVRLESGYIDEGSGLFLGKRIENLTDRVMDDLLRKKRRGDLDKPGSYQLKTAYFLKRRLAGGCE